jgi:hypothetical protein
MSRWGLGLFLAEPVEEEDLIIGNMSRFSIPFKFRVENCEIEYTGELIYEPTTMCRELVRSL